MKSTVLVVLMNNDCLCAYPIGDEPDSESALEVLRQVREGVQRQLTSSKIEGDPSKVRCQLVWVDNPLLTAPRFSFCVINDIVERVLGTF